MKSTIDEKGSKQVARTQATDAQMDSVHTKHAQYKRHMHSPLYIAESVTLVKKGHACPCNKGMKQRRDVI